MSEPWELTREELLEAFDSLGRAATTLEAWEAIATAAQRKMVEWLGLRYLATILRPEILERLAKSVGLNEEVDLLYRKVE